MRKEFVNIHQPDPQSATRFFYSPLTGIKIANLHDHHQIIKAAFKTTAFILTMLALAVSISGIQTGTETKQMSNQEIKLIRDFLAASPDTDRMTLEERRAYFNSLDQQFPTPQDVRVEPVTANGVRAEWVKAADASDERVILYLHGGGYIVGSPTSHRHLVAELSRASLSAALSVDYRLAPEHPFPSAVEDAVSAYRWLINTGVASERIVIAGDSAGGGLTVATMVSLRDQSVALPAGGVCISPWTDLTLTAESYKAKAAADPMINRDQLAMMAAAYLGGADARTPLASPLFADLRRLPPLLVHVGSDEVLLDDSLLLAERASLAGVDTTLEVWDDMIHVWHFFHPMLKAARDAIESAAQFVRERAQ
ncbi:MAG: alpha/beta hydrolase [Acidobacteriota bacterium]